MRRIGRLLAALVTLATVMLTVWGTPSAVAHDHRAPRVQVLTLAGQQAGRLYTVYWTTGDGSGCVTGAGDGFPIFQRRAPVFQRGELVRIRIHKLQAPTGAHIHAWRRLGDDGRGAGAGRSISYTLAPFVADGAIAGWDLLFQAPDFADVYLDLFAEWIDEEGCGGQEDGSWTFHIRRAG